MMEQLQRSLRLGTTEKNALYPKPFAKELIVVVTIPVDE